VLSVGLLFAPGAAHATVPTATVAFGCIGADYGQCSVPTGLSGVTAIAAAGYHSLALKGDGTVVAWGCSGDFGNFGQCTVPNGLSGVTAIAAGRYHSVAVKGDGTVVAWGCGGGFTWGQCSVPIGLSGVIAVAAATVYTVALKSDGTVVAWGCNYLSLTLCTVPSGLSNVTAIAAGEFQALALRSDGTVVAWGCNVGFMTPCNVPSGLSGVTAIAAGNHHSLALKGDGTVVAWGCTSSGDVGQCAVPSGLSGVSAIAAGEYQSLAVKSDGTVVAWGCGTQNWGQCSAPSGLPAVTAVAAGLYHSLALVDPAQQRITFDALAVKRYGDPDFAVSATATSGLPVSFAATGSCTMNGATVHLTGAGSCAITALQPGNADYNAAPSVSRTFAVVKANQTITFAALPGKMYGDPDFAVAATGSSGLTVSLAASGNCTLAGATVHLTGAGACTITASQPGDANYNAAASVSQTIAIAKANQTISFAALANKTYGAPDFTVSATASSGLAVSLAASGRCTVSRATVHLTGAGSCTVTAAQPGDANFNAAATVSQSFAIAKAPVVVRCKVPKVVGKKLAAAKLALKRAHCATGKVSRAYSKKIKKDRVSSQSKRAGRVLPKNTKVNLVVSRGRKH
jgi:hypothetical protein